VACVLIGAQVRQAGGLLNGLGRGEAMGADVIQVWAQSARQWRRPYREDEYAAFGEALGASGVVHAALCHAPYLINLASPDDELYQRSSQCLTDNLRAGVLMGVAGVVLHPGSHLGAGLDSCIGRLALALRAALDASGAGSAGVQLLLENTAGAGGTLGRTFDELAAILEAAGDDPRIGVCLDTQHLWASGIGFEDPAAADAVVRSVHRNLGLERLRCIHLNDSKVPFAANRDRHENLGAGTIGESGLRAILGQPRLQALPAVLEVPGVEHHGPGPLDLAAARRLHREGIALRAGRTRTRRSALRKAR
jgi:deoxyribonuclease-4